MKILIVKSYPKLTFALTLALGLRKLGHQVEIAVPLLEDDARIANENGILVHKVDIRGSLFTNNFLGKRYHDVKGLIELAGLYHKGNYDIISLNLTRGRVLGRIAHLIVKKGIVVSTIHGEDLNNPRYLFMEKMTNWIDKSTIAVSGATREYLLRNGVNSDKLETIYNGIDLELYDRVPVDKNYLFSELNLSRDSKIIGMIAYFYPGIKGHETFLEAARIVLRKTNNQKIKFILVGSDPYQHNYSEQMKNYAQKLGIADSVFFLGERKDIPNVIDSFEMLVLPSNVKEGFGLVLIEAMARGIACIGSGLGAIPEVIEEGKTGMLIPPRSAPALADAIIALLRNPERLKEMGTSGRKRVENNFTTETMARKYERLFLNLIQKIKPGNRSWEMKSNILQILSLVLIAVLLSFV